MMFNQTNVKKYVIKDPPYAWKDISEEAKHEAMMRLSFAENSETQPYWNMGWQTDEPGEDCPNWIAQWFLYHQFQIGYQGMKERRRFLTRDDELGTCNKTWSTLTVGHQRRTHLYCNLTLFVLIRLQPMTSNNLPREIIPVWRNLAAPLSLTNRSASCGDYFHR